ncbi:MAG: hypothetical protein P8X79_15685 [Reinekea sp.]|jgi:hypothetical protein
MPVTVESSVTLSRWQWFFDLLPLLLSLLTLFLFGFYLFLPVVALAGGWVWFNLNRDELLVQHLRFDGERVVLWLHEGERQSYQWRGEGWRTPLFLRWNLVDDQGLKLAFYLWKDSVSEPSWRALNMAFRVNQTLVKVR